MKTSPYVGYALLVAAFLAFLFYGNVAPAVVLLALGVVFVVAGSGGGKGAATT